MTRLGADLERAGQGRVAAVGAVVVERSRVDDADPAEEGSRHVVCRRRVTKGVSARRVVRLEHGHDADGIDGRVRKRRRCLAREREERRRSAIAQPQARTAQPRRVAVPCRLPGRPHGPRQIPADRLRAGQPARDVVADVGHDGRPRGRGEQGVEGGHAVGLGRSDGQALADVVERRGADPADPRLDRVECRDQEGAAGPRCVAAARSMSVRAAVAWSAHPARLRRAQDGVDRGPFRRRRERPDDVQIHRVECSHQPVRRRRCFHRACSSCAGHAGRAIVLRSRGGRHD